MLITRAAIMFSNGEVLEGHDYGAIATIANKLSLSGEKIYGYVTSSGDFVLPDEAAAIAVKSGQLLELVKNLTPEDLWPSRVMD